MSAAPDFTAVSEPNRGGFTPEELEARTRIIEDMKALQKQAIQGGMRVLDRDEVNELLRRIRMGEDLGDLA